MTTPLSPFSCLFLCVRSHSQLRHHLRLQDTQRAANQSGLQHSVAVTEAESCKVVEIHPLERDGSPA
jgi:hypothetical protein